MIDPNQVTNTARTPEELEEFLLFCVVVAGKNAAIRSLRVYSIPRPGYCLTTLARISPAFFDEATFAYQSAMYFFMNSMDAMFCVAPGP